MAITVAEVEDAIRRALLNGEEWETGDIRSRTNLERLVALKNSASANSNGIQFHVVGFQNPSVENTG